GGSNPRSADHDHRTRRHAGEVRGPGHRRQADRIGWPQRPHVDVPGQEPTGSSSRARAPHAPTGPPRDKNNPFLHPEPGPPPDATPLPPLVYTSQPSWSKVLEPI